MSSARASWERHANFGGLASMLLHIHDSFRFASARLGRAGSPGELRWSFQPLARTLHHHHHAEEALLFPLVARQTGVHPAELEADHVALTEAIDAVERALGTATDGPPPAVATFQRVLVEHLDREEALVVPVLLALDPDEAHRLLYGL